MNRTQFRTLIVQPTLDYLQIGSTDAEELLMLTAAQESHLGEFIHQINGPALGWWQIEPFTYEDCWKNYINARSREPLADKLKALAASRYRSMAYPPASELAVNPMFACGMARVKYLRAPGKLPAADDLTGMAQYYKAHYNSAMGAATIQEVVANYRRYVQ